MQQFDFGFAGTASQAGRARATRREADWRRQLARAFVYATGQAPERADELLAETLWELSLARLPRYAGQRVLTLLTVLRHRLPRLA